MSAQTDNAKLQFRVLRRQFLFRVVDLEILSGHAQGDASKLLGQFAALLVLASVVISFGAFSVGAAATPDARMNRTLPAEHFLIATTMLVVGLFAVLSWDSIFPDRRDVLVLAPLPVAARTIFLSKLAATATMVGLVVVLLHCAAGLTWPFALAVRGSGIVGFGRAFAAYWLTMLAAGALIYCSVMAVEGLAARILPRRVFLRVSGVLQTAAFCVFVSTYFLERTVDGLGMLTALRNQVLLRLVPTYWFLGLFNELNGSMHPALVPLARRAWIALALSVIAATAAYALSYLRVIRQIVEQPDLAPAARGVRWLPRFGNSRQTAIGQFCVRTLARSRQHRLILALYLGIGLAFTVLLVGLLATAPQPPGGFAPDLWHRASAPLLAASIVMMALAVIGTRAAFGVPLELRANWIFRAVGLQDVGDVLTASRRALLLLSVAPVWLISAGGCFWLWPWRQAAAHLALLGLLGTILADLFLYGFRKIPFACSYLPGKSQVHMKVVAAVVVLSLAAQGVLWEQRALQEPRAMLLMLLLFGAAAIATHRVAARAAALNQEGVQFEEEAPALVELGLYRDGAVTGGVPAGPLGPGAGHR